MIQFHLSLESYIVITLCYHCIFLGEYVVEKLSSNVSFQSKISQLLHCQEFL